MRFSRNRFFSLSVWTRLCLPGGKCVPPEYQAAAAVYWFQIFVTEGKVCFNVTSETAKVGFIQRGERKDGVVNPTKYSAFVSVYSCQEQSKQQSARSEERTEQMKTKRVLDK